MHFSVMDKNSTLLLYRVPKNAVIPKVKHMDKNSVTVKQGDYQLTAKLLQKNSHPLAAPNHGLMNRTIHESASCKAYYQFSYKGKALFEFISNRASYELEYKTINQ